LLLPKLRGMSSALFFRLLGGVARSLVH
ncbi:MAG: hypothetical protein JWP44_4600, partial [Mucilaginibacter sp.]|nr:hypothetical protein [Mucilaginibacter sp.]